MTLLIIKRKNRMRITRFFANAQRAVNVYKDLLKSVGEETEAPHDALVIDFMEWLANELATLREYMTIGRDYASFVSIHAFAQALEECRCDHFEKFKINDLQSYWNAPARAHEAGKKFFLWVLASRRSRSRASQGCHDPGQGNYFFAFVSFRSMICEKTFLSC